MAVIEVTDADFNEKVLKSDTPVLVDFWAPWCGPCRQMAPILDEVAKELDERLVVAKLNVDENPRTAHKYSIVSIPTMAVFSGGDVIKAIVGGRPKAQMLSELESVLN
ncbi:MAG: thioredoxin [Actinomycetaceae bacterium]|nr:thioredoxin [Actinomycetaceae bacterium]